MKKTEFKDYFNKEDDLLTARIFGVDQNKLLTKKYNNNTTKKCYLTSNEYLDEVFENMDLTSKRVVTVGSSGDQALNAIFKGSRDVTIIDANPYVKPFVEYKIAFFKNYSFKEMKSIFSTIDLFSWEVYSKISHDLPEDVKAFWDVLMLEVDDDKRHQFEEFNSYDIFRNLTHLSLDYCSYFYTNENSYNELKNVLLNDEYKIKYKVADVFDFPKVLKEKYDLIMLSNIFDYMFDMPDKNSFRLTVKSLYRDHLNPGGSIQVAYYCDDRTGKIKNMDDEFGFFTKSHFLMKSQSENGKPRSVNRRSVYVDKPQERELI